MAVTLSDVVRAARAHRAPLAGESAGYLILALTDQVSHAPRIVQPLDIELTEDGGLRVTRGQASSEADAEIALRGVLDGLLLVASSPNAALLRASRRAQPAGLLALVRELEAALIPVNRGAARRALARLRRETARALASGELRADDPPAPGSTTQAKAPRVVAGLELDADYASRAATRTPPASHGGGALLGPEPTPGPAALSDELAIAIDVHPLSVIDEPVPRAELGDARQDRACEPASDRTFMRVSSPGAETRQADGSVVDLPAEECTRPEPILLRHARQPFWGGESAPAPQIEAPAFTPTLGSMVSEPPMLDGELAVLEERTESMPEVAPLLPSVAIVPSRRSSLAELLHNFQVAESDSSPALGRAIKEMAELDLTPAWNKT